MTDDDINCRVTVKSALWDAARGARDVDRLAAVAGGRGDPIPPAGDRNRRGLTTAGEVAVLEAMRLGMVIDMDHMSEQERRDRPHDRDEGRSRRRTRWSRPTTAPAGWPHARSAPTAPPSPPALPPPPAPQVTPPKSEYRRGEHLWPNENSKSAAQLQLHQGDRRHVRARDRAAPIRGRCGRVANDCPGTTRPSPRASSTSTRKLKVPIGLGTDWNALLVGPGSAVRAARRERARRRGGRRRRGMGGAIRSQRFEDAKVQTAGRRATARPRR